MKEFSEHYRDSGTHAHIIPVRSAVCIAVLGLQVSVVRAVVVRAKRADDVPRVLGPVEQTVSSNVRNSFQID